MLIKSQFISLHCIFPQHQEWITYPIHCVSCCIVSVIITVRNCSCGRVMFLHLSVCHSVQREVYTPLGRHSPCRHPPGRHIPWAPPPPIRRPLQRMVRNAPLFRLATIQPIHSTKNERASVCPSIVIETNGSYLKYRILGGNGCQVGSMYDQLLSARNVRGDHQRRLKNDVINN